MKLTKLQKRLLAEVGVSQGHGQRYAPKDDAERRALATLHNRGLVRREGPRDAPTYKLHPFLAVAAGVAP